MDTLVIAVDAAEQEQRLIAGLLAPSPYSGPARMGSVFNVDDPVVVVDLVVDVDGDVESQYHMERKGKVVDVHNGLTYPVLVGFSMLAGCPDLAPEWFKDAELDIDEAALLMADRAAQQAYEA